MKSTALLLLAALMSFSSYSQDQPCASGDIHEQLLENDELYQRSYYHLERRIHEMQEEAQQRSSVVEVLPVVVHVIHEGEAIGSGSNISEAQILSAITAMNEDFRKEAGSLGDGNGVDVEMEFCLAARDPNGDPTTGIVRVDGSGITDYSEQGIQATGSLGADEALVKALSTWPREDYINIWVVNEIEDNDAQGGIQGFAYFPVDSPLDGITMLYNAFGTVGTLKPNTNLNRTLTHEMGHYFALYHTFHSSSDCTETNCNTQGDRVCDTPVTILNSTCSSPECSGTQQVENYLDYTAESCRNMFTQGQSDRMWSTLNTERSTLLSSLGCAPVSDLDAGIYNIESPAGGMCSGDIPPEIVIANYGSTDITSVTIEYGVGAYTHTYDWTGSLTAGATTLITLPTISAADGVHTFMVHTLNPNGGSDEIGTNDASTSEFTVGAGAQVVMTVTVDYFGQETSWEIRNDASEVVALGGPFENNVQGTDFVSNLCFPVGCYTLHVFDEFGDGMSFTSGSYLLEDAAGNILASGSGDFGEEAIHDFCLEEGTIETDPIDPPIAGMDFDNGQICESTQVDFTSTSTGESITIYSWLFENGIPNASSMQNPNDIAWYNPGTYLVSLTVTNSAGSNTTESYITIADQPTVSLSATDISCAGAGDGSISASVSDSGPYTYIWNTGATGATLSGLDAGTYTVTASNGGCEASESTTISEPNAIQANLLTWDEDCSGTPGSANVAPDGGSGALSVSWSSGSSTDSAGDLEAGTYSVTVTDAQGCSITEDFTIQSAAPLSIEVNTTEVDCHGASTGGATLSITGGTGNYNYSWSDGSSGSSLSGLGAGSYSVSVLDDGGCEATTDFSITEPNALSISVNTVDALCFGDANGEASASAAGGSGGLSISWNTGSTGTDLMGISAGTYTASVTDSNGCSASDSGIVDEPEPISVSVFKQNVTCFGFGDGTAQASANGGSGDFAFSWNTGATTPMIESIDAGDYTVTVTDVNGCIGSESATVEEPTAIEINLVSLDIACGEAVGSAYVDPAGGVGFYTINWSNGMNTMEIADLLSGSYSVDVEDANGCSTTAVFEIEQSANLVLDVVHEDVSCAGLSNGSAVVAVNGGDGIYTYTWSDGSDATEVNSLAPGSYSLTVSDASGCEGSADFSIEEPEVLELTIFKSDISCHGESDGTASASPSGGTGPYSYEWSNGSSTQSVDHLESGSYDLIVKDLNQCEEEETITVIEPSAIVISVDLLTAETCEGSDGSCIANALGGTGMLTYTWSNGSGDQMNGSLGAGSYEVTVTDTNGCSETASIIIPMDCGDGSSSTELSTASCEGQNLTLDDHVYCQEVAFADMYMWRFENLSVGLLSEVYSAGNNPSFALGDVPNLFYGMSMSVSVRVMVSGVWGPYSATCNMTMAADIPTTMLSTMDCDRMDLGVGDILTADTVTGATVYEWQFTNENHTVVATSYTPTLEIQESFELEPESLYAVDIRTEVGPDWSDWGDVCPVTTGILLSIEVIVEDNPEINIYPNPTDGQNISFEIANLSTNNNVIDLELYDSGGQLIERFEVQAAGQTKLNHSFQQQLSSGVYILRYRINTLLREERLIVR